MHGPCKGHGHAKFVCVCVCMCVCVCVQGITQMEGEEELKQTVIILLETESETKNLVKGNQLLFRIVSC
jgi:hypothetical protein